jgi:hypothetical protein
VDLQLHMQSVPIATQVVSSNPTHGEIYSIQHYVIKFVSDLRQVCGLAKSAALIYTWKLTMRAGRERISMTKGMITISHCELCLKSVMRYLTWKPSHMTRRLGWRFWSLAIVTSKQ